MVRTMTPTISRILFAGTIALLSLDNFLASQSLAQTGLFRKPSFNSETLSASKTLAQTKQIEFQQNESENQGAKTAQLTSHSTSLSSPHLPSHQNRSDLGIKQTGQQDPIDAWLQTREQGTLSEEELPVGSSLPIENRVGGNEAQDAGLPADSESSDSDSPSRVDREVVVQRYSDGKPQIERQVMQDEEGNYLNDGFWRVYSQQGQGVILAQGQYRQGVMEGTWMRKHAKNSSGLFATKPFSMFEGPFVSIATFKSSKLDGLWTLLDAANQKMFEVPYQNGKRHGTASWWYPSQTKMREVTFVDGVISGRLREWDEQKKLVRDEEYVKGQRLIRNVTYYRPQQIETENYYLDAKLELDGEDDWWRAEPARMVPKGSRVQHGPVAFWYENGMPKLKGNYDQGQPVGRFTAWHPSGNKRMEGSFEKGKKEGLWRWWHPNGKKASEQFYKSDQPSGTWTWWNELGEVEDEKDHDDLATKDNASADDKDSSGQSVTEELPDGIESGSEKKEENETKKSEATDPQSVFDLNLDGLDPQQPSDGQPKNSSSGNTSPEVNASEPKSDSDKKEGGNSEANPSGVPNPSPTPTTSDEENGGNEIEKVQGSFEELMESHGKR